MPKTSLTSTIKVVMDKTTLTQMKQTLVDMKALQSAVALQPATEEVTHAMQALEGSLLALCKTVEIEVSSKV